MYIKKTKLIFNQNGNSDVFFNYFRTEKSSAGDGFSRVTNKYTEQNYVQKSINHDTIIHMHETYTKCAIPAHVLQQ